MTKWTLPEGRKPLTDADIAALTRRLAGTAVDYKELYEASKRDAEEAEAYAAELEKDRRKTYEALLLVSRLHSEVEAKLAKAVKAIEQMQTASDAMMLHIARTTLAELGKDRTMTDSTDNALADPRVKALVAAADAYVEAADPVAGTEQISRNEWDEYCDALEAYHAARAAFEGGKTDE